MTDAVYDMLHAFFDRVEDGNRITSMAFVVVVDGGASIAHAFAFEQLYTLLGAIQSMQVALLDAED